MEELGRIERKGYRFNCCDLDGRVMAVDSHLDRIRLTEFILGDTVEERVTETDLEAWWGHEGCYHSVAPWNHQILVVGRSEDEKSAASCLIDPFTGPDDRSGEIRKDRVTVEWLDVEVEGFEYESFSEMVRVGRRIIFSYRGRDPLWELMVDEEGHRLTGRKLGIILEHGMWTCFQPVSDHEMVVIGGQANADMVSLVDLDSETVQKLPSPPHEGCYLSSILLLDRFILVAGGHNAGLVRGMSILDIQTRKWSVIRRGGDWWNGDLCPLLSLSGGYIYLIKDYVSDCCSRISLESLAVLIDLPDIRVEFFGSMGYPPQQVIHLHLIVAWRCALADLGEHRLLINRLL